jgi:L-alanine-DL-glutamate epimerase-like enolase superfamily enzyme
MRISKFDTLMIALQLNEPFRFAYGTFYEIPRVIIRVEAESDGEVVVGWGEAAIDFPFVPYDSLDTYLALSNLGAQVVGERVGDRLQYLVSTPLKRLRATPAAYCAVNMALDDAAARARGVDAGRLYGRTRGAGTPLCSVGFDQAADPRSWERAVGIIKLKVGAGIYDDVKTIKLAGRMAGETGKSYALDFNAAYTLEEVFELLKRLGGTRRSALRSCVIIEQPIKGDSTIQDWQTLVEALCSPKSAPTVVADESFISAAAGAQLAKAGVGLNYKIQKFGGILAALELENNMGEAARDMKSFIGGTFPSPLGRAYDNLAAQVIRSASLPGDGLLPASTYLNRESADAFEIDGNGPGLGVRPNEIALASLKVEDPVEEFYRIRTGRKPERIKMDVGDSYAEMYARLSGRNPLWNIRMRGSE